MALPSVIEFAMCGACVAWSFETILCTPCSLVTRPGKLTAMMQNVPRLRGNSLLYAFVVMLSATSGFVPDGGGFVDENKVT